MRFKIIVSLLVMYSGFYCGALNYTVYNNLTTVASKFIKTKRYKEANLIYQSISNNYSDFFKTTDLFYWSFSLAKLGQDSSAFEKLIYSLQLSNDNNGVLWKVKNDTTFNFLNHQQLLILEDIHPKYNELTAIDSNLMIPLFELKKKDDSIQNILISNINRENGNEDNQINQILTQENLKNSIQFVELINKYGYPDNLQMKSDCELLLFHLHKSQWDKIKNTLINALKEGKIRPFVYAYTYFRTHDLNDLYHSLDYFEIQNYKISIEETLQFEMGYLGLGI